MQRLGQIHRFLFAILLSVIPTWGQVSVLTQHNDNGRTGANLNETILNASNVNVNRFGKLFSRAVDGQIYAQPLYVPNLDIPKLGKRNVIFVATQHNTVYAFDADDPDLSTPFWSRNLGPANVTPNADFACSPEQCPYGPYHDLFPELGITGTPVIDLSANALYVVSFTKEEGVYYQRLHALDITTGEEKFGGPVEISGSVPGTGDGQVEGVVSFDAMQHLQRPALLLCKGVIYVAFASHADYNPYHGWVFAYDARTLDQRGIHCTTPDGGAGGIWQSNQGLVGDAECNVYFMTGNSRVARPDLILPNFGESFVKLHLQKEGLAVVDYFTPCNQCCLDRGDTDLGSAGPLLIPRTDRLVGVGKQGIAYLVDKDNMGHYAKGQTPNCPGITTECNTCLDDQIVQRLRVTGSSNCSPIFWESPNGPLIYVWGNSDVLKAYKLVDGLFNTTPDSIGNVPNQWGGGGLSLSADSSKPGTGIVWGTRPVAGSNPITQMGEAYAFDASNGNTLWSSSLNEAFDGVGTHAKYNFPTIANGKVYVPSASGQLHVYGLLPENPPPLVRIAAPTTRSQIVGPRDITLLATARTRDGSPGTAVDFYADGTLIGRAESEPYRIVWKDAPLGHHMLAAIATAPNKSRANSNRVEIDVVSEAPPIGRLISIKFVGLGNPMGGDEVAGVVARPNWNNALSEDTRHSRKEGWLTTLVDDLGAPTGAQMSWTANAAWALPIFPNEPGDVRMMVGYVDTSNTTSTNATVHGLPVSFTAHGYDVYVYFDGDNGNEARTSNFRIGSTIVSGTDAAGVNFSGEFIEAIAGSEGNYVVIPGLMEDRFTLEAIPGFSSGPTRRAPVNSIQIVAHAEAP